MSGNPAKVIGRVGTQDQIMGLRQDIQKLIDWSMDWQMMFNVEKCKVMHLGNKNLKASYEMSEKK